MQIKRVPPWLEALHRAGKAVRFWKTFISGTRNKTDISEALSSICVALEWDDIPSLPLKQAIRELSQAQQDLKACRAHALENRQTFLNTLVAAAALQHNISREKYLKRQLHVEAMKSCYRKLRSALRPTGLRGELLRSKSRLTAR
jgi:hypothetical protein